MVWNTSGQLESAALAFAPPSFSTGLTQSAKDLDFHGDLHDMAGHKQTQSVISTFFSPNEVLQSSQKMQLS